MSRWSQTLSRRKLRIRIVFVYIALGPSHEHCTRTVILVLYLPIYILCNLGNEVAPPVYILKVIVNPVYRIFRKNIYIKVIRQSEQLTA
jgi:hypothetical protein